MIKSKVPLTNKGVDYTRTNNESKSYTKLLYASKYSIGDNDYIRCICI